MTWAIAAALALSGCRTMQAHPFATMATLNSTIVASAGVCAAECGDRVARDASEATLLAELAISSSLSAWFAAWLVYDATGDAR